VELMDIDSVLISSVSRNLSLSQNTKRVQTRKAEDELATISNALEKRPRRVAASDISLARNPVSNFSLVGKSSAKVLRPGGMKFHIPVKLSWVCGGNTRVITVNALIDTGAEVTILNTDFVEKMMMPWVKRENRLRLGSAYGSLLKRSGTVQVKQVQLEVPDARLGKQKILDLVTEVACLEPGCPLILGCDWITAHCDKLRVTSPYGLELKGALEIKEVTDFSEFDEILEHAKYVGLIHEGEMESPRVPTGQAFDVMQITAAENLQGLAERLQTQYRDFVRIFGKEAQAALPAHGEDDMTIDLEPGKQPPSGKLYPLSPDELELLKEYLDEMMKNGKIRPSKSSAGAPIFFAKQANGKLRIVVDYRELNAIPIKDKYPLPLMTTLMEQVGTSQIFSKLDLKFGFNLLCIAEGDEWKTAFKPRYGLCEYTVMPFGLTNAPSVFQ